MLSLGKLLVLVVSTAMFICAFQSSIASAAITASGIGPEETIHVSDRIEFNWFTDASPITPSASLQFARTSAPAAFTAGAGEGPDNFIQILDESDGSEVQMKFLTAGEWYWRMCDTFPYETTLACTAPIHFYVAPLTQCEDSIDNDHDGGTDENDLACKSPTSPSEHLKKIPVLTLSEAKRYAKKVMSNSTRFGYDAAANTPRWRCSRLNRTLAKCKGLWYVGDGGYSARVRIFYRWCRGNAVCWHYSYRVTLRDDYCLITGGSNCVHRYRNTGRGGRGK